MELDEVYRQYFPTVYRYALSLSRDPGAAEELTQETFLKAVEKIDSFRGECSMQTWLCEIAKNTWFKRAAKQKRREHFIEQEAPAAEAAAADPEEELLEKEGRMRIHRVLHGLKEPYKEVLMLRTFSGLSFREIAELFGKSESWARVTCLRARRMIQEELDNENRV